MHTHSLAGQRLLEKEQGQQPLTAASPHATTHNQDSALRIAGLQARLKRRGFDLQRRPSGALLISRWGRAREFDLEGVETFARKVGAT